MQLEWYQIAVGAIVAFLALLGALWGLRSLYIAKWLPRQLRPYLYLAMMAAYKASESLHDSIGERLHGADKKRLAEIAYDLLPDTISLFGMQWQWKRYVSKEMFATAMQRQFDQFADWWDEAGKYVLDYFKPEGDDTMVSPAI